MNKDLVILLNDARKAHMHEEPNRGKQWSMNVFFSFVNSLLTISTNCHELLPIFLFRLLTSRKAILEYRYNIIFKQKENIETNKTMRAELTR